jgi:AAA family ATP:ADP antiporter
MGIFCAVESFDPRSATRLYRRLIPQKLHVVCGFANAVFSWYSTCVPVRQVDAVKRRTILDWLLSAFAPVRGGEGPTALLLMTNLFLLMTAYYIIKPVRECLILGDAGPETKSYAGAMSALVFLLIVPVYGKIASRVNRIRLINGVTAFFASNLLIFYGLSRLHVSLGVVFFVWVGLSNLMLVAQFWAFTNDVYTQEQGRRLFAIIGIGSSAGAVFGAEVAGRLFTPLGPYNMLLIAAGMLGICMILSNCIHHRENGIVRSLESAEPLKSEGAFQVVFKERYLLLIALLIILSNVVNTNGEFMLGKSVIEHAKLASAVSANSVLSQQQYIARFYADFYFWVNLVGGLLQMFAVSRIMKHVGIGAALFFLPMIALGGYTLLSFAPLLSFIRLMKIAENGTDYSIQNTARHALFLRTSREAKYKGKTAIDSFFWRAGDAISAGIVFVGTALAFDVRAFATTNAVLTAAWLSVALCILWLRLSDSESEPEAAGSLLSDSADADA